MPSHKTENFLNSIETLIEEAAKTDEQWFAEKFKWFEDMIPDNVDDPDYRYLYNVRGNLRSHTSHAVQLLKKNHLLEWYLTWYSYHTMLRLLKRFYRERLPDMIKKVEERLRKKVEGGIIPSLEQLNDSNYDLPRIQHFLSLNYPPIQNLSFLNPFRTPEQMIAVLVGLENRFNFTVDGNLLPESGVEIVRFRTDKTRYSEFPEPVHPFKPSDVWVWVDTELPMCIPEEHRIMKHCGRDDNASTILRLARVITENGKKYHEPHVTMAVSDHQDGGWVIRQTKQRRNNKPDEYTDHIFQLLLTGRISDINHRGAYEPEKNFTLKDLSEEQLGELKENGIELGEAGILDFDTAYQEFLAGFETEVFEISPVWQDLIRITGDADRTDISISIRYPKSADVVDLRKHLADVDEEHFDVAGGFMRFDVELRPDLYFDNDEGHDGQYFMDFTAMRRIMIESIRIFLMRVFTPGEHPRLRIDIYDDEPQQFLDLRHFLYQKMEDLKLVENTVGKLTKSEFNSVFGNGVDRAYTNLESIFMLEYMNSGLADAGASFLDLPKDLYTRIQEPFKEFVLRFAEAVSGSWKNGEYDGLTGKRFSEILSKNLSVSDNHPDSHLPGIHDMMASMDSPYEDILTVILVQDLELERPEDAVVIGKLREDFNEMMNDAIRESYAESDGRVNESKDPVDLELVEEAAKTADQWFDEKFGWVKRFTAEELEKLSVNPELLRNAVEGYVNILKKNHRIEWFMTWFVYRYIATIMDRLGGHQPEWFKELYGRMKDRLSKKVGKSIDVLPGLGYVTITYYMHFLDLNAPSINNLSFLDPFRTPNDLMAVLLDLEKEFLGTDAKFLKPEGEEILRFKVDLQKYPSFDNDEELDPPFSEEDEWVWYDLERISCSEDEKKIMGHCGADSNASTMYRLARVIDRGDHELHEPHVTMSVNDDNGDNWIRQTKKRDNKKASEYSEHIFRLLMTGTIRGFDDTDAYQPENNFHLEDLTGRQMSELRKSGISIEEIYNDDGREEALNDFLRDFDGETLDDISQNFGEWFDVSWETWNVNQGEYVLRYTFYMPVVVKDEVRLLEWVKKRLIGDSLTTYGAASVKNGRRFTEIHVNQTFNPLHYFDYEHELVHNRDFENAKEDINIYLNKVVSALFDYNYSSIDIFTEPDDVLYVYVHDVYKTLEKQEQLSYKSIGTLDEDALYWLTVDYTLNPHHSREITISEKFEKPIKFQNFVEPVVLERFEKMSIPKLRNSITRVNGFMKRDFEKFLLEYLRESGFEFKNPAESFEYLVNNMKLELAPENAWSKQQTDVSGYSVRLEFPEILHSSPAILIETAMVIDEEVSNPWFDEKDDAMIVDIISRSIRRVYRDDDPNQTKFKFAKYMDELEGITENRKTGLSVLTESPDHFVSEKDNELELYWSNSESVTFSFLENTLVYSDESVLTHGELWFSSLLQEMGDNEFRDLIEAETESILDGFIFNGDDGEEHIYHFYRLYDLPHTKYIGSSRPDGVQNGNRTNFDLNGRLWKTDNVVSFWETSRLNEIQIERLWEFFDLMGVDQNSCVFEIGGEDEEQMTYDEFVRYHESSKRSSTIRNLKAAQHTMNLPPEWRRKISLLEKLDSSKVNVKFKFDARPSSASGAGILPFCKETGRFLLNYRSSTVNEPNVWNVWGGGCEDGETFREAARRELAEESGWRGSIELTPLYKTRAKNSDYEFQMFLGEVPEEYEPSLNNESDGYRWVDYGEMSKTTPLHWGFELLLKFAGKRLSSMSTMVTESKARNTPPPGYKVSIYVAEDGQHDVMIWTRDSGNPLLQSLGETYPTRDEARLTGIRRAWEIYDSKRSPG